MTKTASRFLHAAERMESAAQALYADLAVAFTEHPHLRQLFQRLAAEEEQHAMRIRLLQRHQGKAPWPPEILDRFCGECDAMVAEMEKIRAELGRSPASSDARATLRRLAELEDRFCSIHAQDLARYAAPEVEKLFATLALQDSAHRDLVVAAMLTEVA
jgi:rubrerythrin